LFSKKPFSYLLSKKEARGKMRTRSLQTPVSPSGSGVPLREESPRKELKGKKRKSQK
jgi:hypothetical protein